MCSVGGRRTSWSADPHEACVAAATAASARYAGEGRKLGQVVLTVSKRLLSVVGEELKPENGVLEAAQRVDVRVQRRVPLDLRAERFEEPAEDVRDGLP